MKTNPCCLRWICSLVTGLMLLGAAVRCPAATFLTESYTNSFDDSASVTSYIYWYGLGYNNTAMTWDPAMDAQSDPNSGSLQVVLPFTTANDQGVWFGTFGNGGAYDKSVLLDGTLYTNITFDLRVDPGTTPDTNGNFGILRIGMVNQNTDAGGYTYFGGQTIPGSASNGWVHFVQPIDRATPNLNICLGPDFKLQKNGGPYPASTFTMWIDNIQVNKAPPPPPPTMKPPLAAKPGLNLFSNGTDQNQRTSIEVVNGLNAGWVGFATAANPVTYSVTITDYPPAPYHLDYQTHIFITTDNPPVYRTNPDEAATNSILLDIRSTATGGQGNFRYKINQPNSSANLNGPDNGTAGTLATVAAPSVLGTWSMTFSNDTSVTLRAPDGSSTNFSLSAAAAAQFDEANAALNPTPLSVYVGARPNNAINVGQRVVVGGFQMTGNPGAVSDGFSGAALDTATWLIVTENQGTVIFVPPDPSLFTQWTVPDGGFGLQSAAALESAGTLWTLLTGTNATVGPYPSVVLPSGKITLVPFIDVGSTNEAFFRMISGQ